MVKIKLYSCFISVIIIFIGTIEIEGAEKVQPEADQPPLSQNITQEPTKDPSLYTILYTTFTHFMKQKIEPLQSEVNYSGRELPLGEFQSISPDEVKRIENTIFIMQKSYHSYMSTCKGLYHELQNDYADTNTKNNHLPWQDIPHISSRMLYVLNIRFFDLLLTDFNKDGMVCRQYSRVEIFVKNCGRIETAPLEEEPGTTPLIKNYTRLLKTCIQKGSIQNQGPSHLGSPKFITISSQFEAQSQEISKKVQQIINEAFKEETWTHQNEVFLCFYHDYIITEKIPTIHVLKSHPLYKKLNDSLKAVMEKTDNCQSGKPMA